ncbi:MAG: dephospho-CoA kinase [Clostridiales bacterium]|nr:dephospho-CoA kinase [Clostridiales bacterium]
MRIIGLTGGIACGKSNISETLQEMGAVIIDGDKLSRELTAPGGDALPLIRDAFGEDVFAPDGTLMRRALGDVIFSSAEKRQMLDDLMQPLLLNLIKRRIREAEEAGAAACVLDMPLLYEAGLDKLCDTVWCAYLPPETQLERLMARDGFTEEEALKRLSSQMDPAEKARRAHVVIDTSGSILYTKAMIPDLYQQELAKR